MHKLRLVPSIAPDALLHIYYLEGRVRSGTDLTAPGFVGNWEEDGFSFLFYTRPGHAEVDNLLNRQPQLVLRDSYCMSYAQWLGEIPTRFRVGCFLIRPPWDTAGGPEGEYEGFEIVLDPGVVFGTGTHTTTRDSLLALEQVFTGFRPHSVVDLGCGTGLLALAAAALGSRRTLAVDRNLLAVRTAAANIRRNRMEDRVLAVQGKAETLVELPAELVMANLHHAVMEHLVATDGFRAKPWFVLSGLLRSQACAVSKRLKDNGAEVTQRLSGDGVWHTFLGRNPSAAERRPLPSGANRLRAKTFQGKKRNR